MTSGQAGFTEIMFYIVLFCVSRYLKRENTTSGLAGCATIEVPVCESCDNQLEPANARDDEDLLHFRMLQARSS